MEERDTEEGRNIEGKLREELVNITEHQRSNTKSQLSARLDNRESFSLGVRRRLGLIIVERKEEEIQRRWREHQEKQIHTLQS